MRLLYLMLKPNVDVGADEHITLDLRYIDCINQTCCAKTDPLFRRGTRFTLSRDELLTLPEFVLLSLFPNGLLPDGHMNSFHEGDIYSVDVCHGKSWHTARQSSALTLISSMILSLSNICSNSSGTLLKRFPPLHRHLPDRHPTPKKIRRNHPPLLLAICFKTEPASSY